MATRTELIASASFIHHGRSGVSGSGILRVTPAGYTSTRRPGSGGPPRRTGGRTHRVRWLPVAGLAAGALGCDELLQPTDFALASVQSMPLQFERVSVEPFRGAAERLPHPFASFLYAASTTLENSQARVGVGASEEREVHAETGVFERLRAKLGEQRLEPLLAFCGDLVDDAAALRGQGRNTG